MVPPATPPTAADAAVAALRDAGCNVVFANPGTTEMWFVSALDKCPGVRSILVLHETVAAGAADGYARMARRPAATLLHLGPGLANGLANLHNARRARSPVVNIIGPLRHRQRSITFFALLLSSALRTRHVTAQTSSFMQLYAPLIPFCTVESVTRGIRLLALPAGDMASWHATADPPLAMDIAALAGTVSR